MKALVVGGGSIGCRHLKNLADLGVASLGLVEIRKEAREQLRKELGTESFATLEEGLAWAPQVAIVATPSHLHIEQATIIAEHGIDLFIEKPLSHRPEGISLLIERLERRACVSLVRAKPLLSGMWRAGACSTAFMKLILRGGIWEGWRRYWLTLRD